MNQAAVSMGQPPLSSLPDIKHLPKPLQGDLRSDHAGETGAVYIYRGILAVCGDSEIRRFAEEHLQTERRHLQAFEDWLTPAQKSRLIPLWRIAGWCLGAAGVLGGRGGVYLTIEAVERFVVQHYADQIAYIDRQLAAETAPGPDALTVDRQHWQSLRALLAQFMHDEDHHREDASDRAARKPGTVGRVWAAIVGGGSAQAVKVSRVL